jgi:hypothetical protein
MKWPFVVIRKPGGKVERIPLPSDPAEARRLGEQLWRNQVMPRSTDSFDRYLAQAAEAEAKGSKPCTMGVGCQEAGVCYASAMGEPNRCDAKPGEPSSGESVWYRGWEAGYEPERGNWTGEGYVAYKGGCDEGAPQAHGATWAALLEAIDDEEDE